MAKRKRRAETMPVFKPTPPGVLMEEDAERLAENAIKADPQIQRRKQQIRARVLKAAKSGARAGRRGA